MEGLINQSFADWKALFINDGSTDDSSRILDERAQFDARIEALHFERNQGVVAARNAGLDWAQGEWIAFCDADDQWLPEKLERQLAASLGKDLVCSSYWELRPGKANRLIATTGRISYQGLLVTNPIPFSTALVRRTQIGNLRFAELPAPYIHEDYAFWLRLFQAHTLTAIYLAEPLVCRSVNSNSRSFDKLLGARSHDYVLKTVAGVVQPKRFILMMLYVWNAVFKKIINPLLS